MSRIPVFVEKSPRKNWNKKAETCIFIARESVKTSSEVEDDVVNDNLETVSNNSVSVSVVSCVRGVVNSSCYCPDCKEISRISTKSRTKDGMKKSFIPIKDGGVKTFGWNGSKLTPAKSILTPAPVKVKSRLKTKSKAGDEGMVSSKMLAPAKSAQSPQRAFRSAFKVIPNNETGSSSKQIVDKSAARDSNTKRESKYLTSFEYEDSEPECFQHEIPTRLASDSPASVKGLKNCDIKKHQQERLKSECNSQKEIENESKTLIGSYEENKDSQTIIKLQYSRKPELNSEQCRKHEIKHTSNAESLDKAKDVELAINDIYHDADNDAVVTPHEEISPDQSFTNETLDEISSIQTTVLERISDSDHLEIALNNNTQLNERTDKVDDSGHVTCVISSPPSGRAAEVAKNHGTSKNRQNTSGTTQKTSKLPLFYKRKLPKPPSEVRTVKYGQKIIQENKENRLQTCKKSKGSEGIPKIKKTLESSAVRNKREQSCKEGLYLFDKLETI